MRKLYIERKTRNQAKKYAPWAAVIARTAYGFMAFESVDDYRTWRAQK